MPFTYQLRPAPTSIVVDGLALPWTINCKYLCLILDRPLSWHQHLRHKREKLFLAINALLPLSGRNRELDLPSKDHPSPDTYLWVCGLGNGVEDKHRTTRKTQEREAEDDGQCSVVDEERLVEKGSINRAVPRPPQNSGKIHAGTRSTFEQLVRLGCRRVVGPTTSEGHHQTRYRCTTTALRTISRPDA